MFVAFIRQRQSKVKLLHVTSVQVRRRARDVQNPTSALSSRIHFHKEFQSLKCVLFLLDEDTFNPAISEVSGANVPVFDFQKPEHVGSESSVKVFSALHYLTSILSGSLVLVSWTGIHLAGGWCSRASHSVSTGTSHCHTGLHWF